MMLATETERQEIAAMASRPADAPALTKIIATIGPASSDPDQIRSLIDCGVGIFRLNFSHGDLAGHGERLKTIRSVAERLGAQVGVLGDLQGPKIRVTHVAGDGIELATGTIVRIDRDRDEAEVSDGTVRLGCTCAELIDEVEPGHRVLINDGAVRMLAVERSPTSLLCTVTYGGLVTSGKGINVPDTSLSVSTMTDTDWRNARWAVENGLDFLALSFVRTAEDVQLLREGLPRFGSAGASMPVIAKIELPQAVEGIDEIVDVADGVMVARGDLGVELELSRVPVIQKEIVRVAQHHGKACIVATQMFESMLEAPAPTRAEVNDVACAIFDRADAVMLSGETAVGQYPVLAVEHMRQVAVNSEKYLAAQEAVDSAPGRLIELQDREAALAHGASTVTRDVGAVAVVAWSQQGIMARLLSRQSLPIPIVAVSSDEATSRRMQLLRGVVPLTMEAPPSIDAFGGLLEQYLVDHGIASRGDAMILIAGDPLGRPGGNDSLRVWHIR